MQGVFFIFGENPRILRTGDTYGSTHPRRQGSCQDH